MSREQAPGAGPARVYIIGGGPGDPGLVTVRGLECLRSSDVIVHDHLIPQRLLDHASAGAEVIDVGHVTAQAMAQEAISYLVADKVREGKTVARLKWGDPFVFDRAGEEALYLREQGIDYEVIPGIPAGIAAPAYAGIPVTYPGGGDTVTFVHGYEDEQRNLPDIDWAALVRLEGTIVCYAMSHVQVRVLEQLTENGWPTDGRAAIIYHGTLPNQETIEGTLAELIAQLSLSTRRTPAILVIGVVVGFRQHLRWFDTRPLFGKRVLVTRPREQAADLIARLRELGAEAVEAPMIRIADPEDSTRLYRAAAEPSAFDWIVFTSANAVQAFMRALLATNRDVRSLNGPLLCVVGSGTADTLAGFGIKADLMPEEFRAEGVVAALTTRGSLDGARVLLPRADIGRDVIADELRQQGAVVTDVIAYRTILDETPRDKEPDVYRQLLERRIDVVTFTSGSAVRNFAKVFGQDQAADLLRNTVVAAIGPVTAEAAAQLGIRVTIQPASYTIASLVDAIAEHFQTAKPAV